MATITYKLVIINENDTELKNKYINHNVIQNRCWTRYFYARKNYSST